MASTATPDSTPIGSNNPPEPIAVAKEISGYPPPLPAPFHLTNPAPILIAQGAEALLYRTHFLTPSQPAVLKVRPSKTWRHPTLDARLTKQRVLAEARVLVKLAGIDGVTIPGVLSMDWHLSRRVKGLHEGQRGLQGGGGGGGARTNAGTGAWLMMEWIEGKSVKELLRLGDLWLKAQAVDGGQKEEVVERYEEDVKKLLRRIGKAIGAVHSKGGIVHGDLTTSNIMVRRIHDAGAFNRTLTDTPTNGDVDQAVPMSPPRLDGDIVLIDFGLATQSIQDEDRAVDLYVLERAFGSTHPRQEGWFDAEVLQSTQGYRGSFKESQVALKRLEEVRLRGRKRSMIG